MDLNWCGGLIVALLIGLASPEASGSKSTWVDLGENVEMSSSFAELVDLNIIIGTPSLSKSSSSSFAELVDLNL